MRKPIAFLSALMLLGASAIAGELEQLPLVEHNGVLCHYYVVQPKETVYSLSNRLGITPEQLIAANPSVADGLKAHSMLYFPVKDSERRARVESHIVQKGETIYGLSKQFGISTEELIAQNPSLRDSGLKAGQTVTVTIPPSVTQDAAPAEASAPAAETPMITAAVTTVTEAPVAEAPVRPQAAVAPAPAEKRPLGIAVMLPFMLSQEKPDKAATRYTEFFKGILLAADTLRNEGAPVSIYAFDTAGSNDTVKAILKRPELRKTSLIIAPDNEEQLAEIARWGRDNDVAVLNTFAVRDKLHLTNPAVMQMNLPHEAMYDMAIDGLTERFPGHAIVIVKRAGGPEDHSEFIDELRSRLALKGVTPLELTYTDKLQASDLKALPAGRAAVFIPVSGKQAELNRIIPALSDLKDNAAMPDDVLLFGYPEWITFRGETLAGMQKLDTTVYSRFYNDPESIDTRNIEESFARWYGTPMEPAQPRQGLLGFDVGMMTIRALRRNGGDFSVHSPHFTGVQNGFDFRRVDPSSGNTGWVNSVLFLVNFRPGGFIDRTML